MNWFILLAASLAPVNGAAFSDQDLASRHLADFFGDRQEYELSFRKSYHRMAEDGTWSLGTRSKGAFLRRQDRWRSIRVTLGIGSGDDVFGAFQELVNLNDEATLRINRKAVNRNLPSIEEIRSNRLDSKWESLQWKVLEDFEDASIKLHADGEPNARQQIARTIPLFTGTTDVHPQMGLAELVRTATSFKEQQCVFLEMNCLEWIFEHEMGFGRIRVAPALCYAPLFIEVTKQPNHKFGEKTLRELGYQSLVSTCQYRELANDFSRFSFESLLVVTQESGGSNGTRSTYDCELVAQSVTDEQLDLTTEISDGADIPVSGARQIKAIWKDRQVVLDYDRELVNELKTLEFSGPVESTRKRSTWWLLILAVGIVALLILRPWTGIGNSK